LTFDLDEAERGLEILKVLGIDKVLSSDEASAAQGLNTNL
jgi:hypothetical protein